MKYILTSFLMFVAIFSFAQTATTHSTSTTQTTVLSAKGKVLCKTWTLSMTENFGDQHKPTDTQKNDLLELKADGSYHLIMNGLDERGTWTLSKDNLWISLSPSSGAQKKLKVIESTTTSLKVDYRDVDEIHNILIYAAASSGK